LLLKITLFNSVYYCSVPSCLKLGTAYRVGW